MLPFTRDQFFGVFAAYNSGAWPAAVLAYPLALAAILAAWRSQAAAGRTVGWILALMWAWVGIVYQGVYFSAINPAARAFAAAFLVQAVVFAIHAIRERGLEFGPRSRLRGVAGAILIGYAMIAYPLIGLFVAGDRYPSLPLFGMTPCPLLIFTFGMLVWASCARWWLWLIPFAWSLIGGSAVLLLSVPQDWALPISAVAVLLITLLDRPLRPRGAQSAGRR